MSGWERKYRDAQADRDRWEARARELGDTLAARDNDLNEARETLASKQQKIQELESSLGDKADEIINLRHELAQAFLQEQHPDLEERENMIANLQAENEALREQLNSLRQKAVELEEKTWMLSPVNLECKIEPLASMRQELALAKNPEFLKCDIAPLASMRQELAAARIQKMELKQQPVALASESQSQPFTPGWVRVTQKEAAEIATRERYCPLDPQKPLSVAMLNNLSVKTLERYGLRRVQKGTQTIYEFYQRTES